MSVLREQLHPPTQTICPNVIVLFFINLQSSIFPYSFLTHNFVVVFVFFLFFFLFLCSFGLTPPQLLLAPSSLAVLPIHTSQYPLFQHLLSYLIYATIHPHPKYFFTPPMDPVLGSWAPHTFPTT